MGGTHRLIVLNGPPAVGKSTLAQRFVDDHPMSLNLDLDRLRLLLGAATARTDEARLAARRLALALATSHLGAGHDVVVPQYLGRQPFLEALEQTAEDSGAHFHEIVLMDSERRLADRFAARTLAATAPEHLLAADGVGDAGPESLSEMRHRLIELVPSRPAAVVVECPEGQEDITYRALLDALGERRS
ncbi:AAA family ATPase [Luteipulveratus sp. YIM 133132]|uniref:AAA family ATPase n=1 Tax=Luteipulveratus flavus TaxID=3031728 RepID=UPI0023B1107E|nr:AAA family ATPase [Luteipulveratus sp. YIM 133132]MDE9367220.1 AAA family ATPase [Luteipulveratus sp. YIM 133132]